MFINLKNINIFNKFWNLLEDNIILFIILELIGYSYVLVIYNEINNNLCNFFC